MEAFHWIVVPISTILGLAIARVLTSYVATFKVRRRIRFDWLPLVVAGVVLGEGLQFWWALLELSTQPSWSLAAFTLLVAMAMCLFTAAAIVVPSEADSDMRLAFENDGRWALVALAGFHVLAIFANRWLFGVPLRSPLQILLGILAALCVAGSATRRRGWQEVIVAFYLCMSVLDTFSASVDAY